MMPSEIQPDGNVNIHLIGKLSAVQYYSLFADSLRGRDQLKHSPFVSSVRKEDQKLFGQLHVLLSELEVL
jgi:hypothetical protein